MELTQQPMVVLVVEEMVMMEHLLLELEQLIKVLMVEMVVRLMLMLVVEVVVLEKQQIIFLQM